MAARAEFRNNPGQGDLLVARPVCYASLSICHREEDRPFVKTWGSASCLCLSTCRLWAEAELSGLNNELS